MNLKQIELDRELIALLGGSTILARRLGFKKQRVNNWNTRGIPPVVKIQFPKIFLKKYTKKEL